MELLIRLGIALGFLAGIICQYQGKHLEAILNICWVIAIILWAMYTKKERNQ
jgi:hypothetical protein